MKLLLITLVFTLGSFAAYGQNEQAPIVEKEFEYKNWSFKKIDGGGEFDLRTFVTGKKLVLVVYFAPWCHNWRFEAPIVQRLYDKYKANGFEVIGVGEYDTLPSMTANVAEKKLTFPVVYESDSLSARLNTTHYGFRSKIGDTRRWGSPLNVFLHPGNILKDGDVIARKLSVSAGELIEPEADAFIREKLGLAKDSKVSDRSSGAEVCEPDAVTLKKP